MLVNFYSQSYKADLTPARVTQTLQCSMSAQNMLSFTIQRDETGKNSAIIDINEIGLSTDYLHRMLNSKLIVFNFHGTDYVQVIYTVEEKDHVMTITCIDFLTYVFNNMIPMSFQYPNPVSAYFLSAHYPSFYDVSTIRNFLAGTHTLQQLLDLCFKYREHAPLPFGAKYELPKTGKVSSVVSVLYSYPTLRDVKVSGKYIYSILNTGATKNGQNVSQSANSYSYSQNNNQNDYNNGDVMTIKQILDGVSSDLKLNFKPFYAVHNNKYGLDIELGLNVEEKTANAVFPNKAKGRIDAKNVLSTDIKLDNSNTISNLAASGSIYQNNGVNNTVSPMDHATTDSGTYGDTEVRYYDGYGWEEMQKEGDPTERQLRGATLQPVAVSYNEKMGGNMDKSIGRFNIGTIERMLRPVLDMTHLSEYDFRALTSYYGMTDNILNSIDASVYEDNTDPDGISWHSSDLVQDNNYPEHVWDETYQDVLANVTKDGQPIKSDGSISAEKYTGVNSPARSLPILSFECQTESLGNAEPEEKKKKKGSDDDGGDDTADNETEESPVVDGTLFYEPICILPLPVLKGNARKIPYEMAKLFEDAYAKYEPKTASRFKKYDSEPSDEAGSRPYMDTLPDDINAMRRAFFSSDIDGDNYFTRWVKLMGGLNNQDPDYVLLFMSDIDYANINQNRYSNGHTGHGVVVKKSSLCEQVNIDLNNMNYSGLTLSELDSHPNSSPIAFGGGIVDEGNHVFAANMFDVDTSLQGDNSDNSLFNMPVSEMRNYDSLNPYDPNYNMDNQVMTVNANRATKNGVVMKDFDFDNAPGLYLVDSNKNAQRPTTFKSFNDLFSVQMFNSRVNNYMSEHSHPTITVQASVNAEPLFEHDKTVEPGDTIGFAISSPLFAQHTLYTTIKSINYDVLVPQMSTITLDQIDYYQYSKIGQIHNVWITH